MKLAKVTDGVVEIVDSASEWPNVSFPKKGPNAEWMGQSGVVPFAKRPSYDRSTHKCVSATPFLEDGKCQRWQAVAKTAEEIAAEQEVEQKRTDKSLKDFLEAQVDPLTQEYSPSEIASWPIQLSEARAYLDDPAAYTPFMDAVCVESGEDKVDYANSIIAKAETYSAMVGKALGKKRKALNLDHTR